MLHNLVNPYKLKPEEQKIVDVVNKLLEHPSTSIKMTPSLNKYFLINEPKKYFIMLKDSSIRITNSKFTEPDSNDHLILYTKEIHHKVYDIIVKNIEESIEQDRQKLENSMLYNEEKILNDIIENLT